MDDLERISIYETEEMSDYYLPIVKSEREQHPNIVDLTPLSWGVLGKAKNVTDQFITGHPGWELENDSYSTQDLRPATDAREVFVVHGRNLASRNALFEFLRVIDLHPLEWSEAVTATGKPSPYIGEVLDAAFSKAHAVIVLFTPDDEARLRQEFRKDNEPPHETELTGQARPNVLFEAGMAMGRHPDRTILVELGSLRPFTDVAGLHVIRMDDSSQRRQELAHRLRTAGCPIKLEGTDWHTAGDFESAVKVNNEMPLELETVVAPALFDNKQPMASEDAKHLLVEAVEDAKRGGQGAIVKRKTLGGTFIETNGKSFGDPGKRRSIARWESAIEELLILRFIEDPTGKDSFFQVTHKGFEAVESQVKPE